MKEKELHLNLTPEDYERMDLDEKNFEYMGHVGTHIDCYTMAPKKNEYLVDVVVVDCRNGLPEEGFFRTMDLEKKALLLYTGNTAKNTYGTKEYFMFDMGLNWETLQTLLEKHPKFILIDSHGMGMFSQHRFFDMAFEKNGCFVIMSLLLDGDDVLDINQVRIEIDVNSNSTGKPCKVYVVG